MKKIEKKKRKAFLLYLTDEQKYQLEMLANKQGLTMTGFIVDVIRQQSRELAE